MRCFIFTLLIAIVAFTCFAQKKEPAFNPESDAPDAIFVSASARNLNSKRDEPDKQSEFSIKVRNVGGKTITAIEWEVTLDAVLSYSESKKYLFRADNKDVKPGDTTKLNGHMDIPITPNHKRAIVRIVRLEFSDKSVWERTKKKSE